MERKRFRKFNAGNVIDYKMTSSEHKEYRQKLRTQTKEIPVFPVETKFVEPTYTGPAIKRKKSRKSTRADGTNPRAKGTNPRANRHTV